MNEATGLIEKVGRKALLALRARWARIGVLSDAGWATDELRLQADFGLALHEAITELGREGAPLAGLNQLLSGDRGQLALLIVTAGADLSTEVARGFGYLRERSGPALPDVALLLDLIAPDPSERGRLRVELGEDGPLLALSLLELSPGPLLLAREARVNEAIIRALAGHSRATRAVVPVDQLVIDPETIARVRAEVERAIAGHTETVVLVGIDGCGRRSLTAAIAAEHDRTVVDVKLAAGPAAIQAAIRAAYLAGSLLHIDLGSRQDSPEIARLMRFAPRPLFGSRSALGQNPGWLGHVVEVEVGVPTVAMRRRLWERWLGAPPPELDDIDLMALTPAEIHQVVATLPASPDPATVRRATIGALQRRAPILGERVGRPASFEELAASAESIAALEELVSSARAQSGVAVFGGPPASGRTDAARAVAASLARPLHRVDMLRYKSRFAEETERTLHRAFAEARAAGAVLLIGGAESVASRGAPEIGALLGLTDAFFGLVILATGGLGQVDRRLAPIAEIGFRGAGDPGSTLSSEDGGGAGIFG